MSSENAATSRMAIRESCCRHSRRYRNPDTIALAGLIAVPADLDWLACVRSFIACGLLETSFQDASSRTIVDEHFSGRILEETLAFLRTDFSDDFRL